MTAITVHNLSKSFRRYEKAESFITFLKKHWFRSLPFDTIQVLDDISFTLEPGSRLGVVGHNGSGKSTLLKIIARLYKETSGTIHINGTVASFLQLGIGLERDLNVLDNIYLFGAIMGITRKRIEQHIDSVIAFAEIEPYLYIPLRNLSEGNKQRLAFSIVHFVDADIVILDEMLSASDIHFRNKCYQFLSQPFYASKTLVLATHNISLMERFCTHLLLLDHGHQKAFGPTAEVLPLYLKSCE